MKLNNLAAQLFKTALAASALLLAGGGAFAQQAINLTAAPTQTVLPDGNVVPMWGYGCGAVVNGSAATCAPLNAAAATAGNWSPVVITIPTGQDLQINLTNSLSFATSGASNNVPTSLTIIGQLGGGLGTNPNYVASPIHPQQGQTWPIANAAGTVFTPPAQAARVQSFATEVAAGATTTLCWGVCGQGLPALKPGTYLIESGTHPSIQAPMGLYGVLVVTSAPASSSGVETANGTAYPQSAIPKTAQGFYAAAGASYDAELPLVFSEIDPVQNNAVQTAVSTAGFAETASQVLGNAITGVTIAGGGAGYTIAGANGTASTSGTLPITFSPSSACRLLPSGTATISNGVVTAISLNPITSNTAGTAYGTGCVENVTATVAGGTTPAQLTVAMSSTSQGVQCGIASGGTSPAAACYPPAVNYTPQYYLINGAAFDKTHAANSFFPTTPATLTGNTVLVRLVNAGLRMHVPAIVGATTTTSYSPSGVLATPASIPGVTLLAEDGNPIPGVPRVMSEVYLPAGKTEDVLINAVAPCTPVAGGTCTTPALPVFDRELSLSGGEIDRDAGMVAFIGQAGASLPAAPSLGAAVANPDSYNVLLNAGGTNQTVTISDPSKGVIANDVNVYGVALLTQATNGTVALNRNGSFTYTPLAGNTATSDSFTYCANGTVNSLVSPPTCSSGITATVSLGADGIAADQGVTCSASGISFNATTSTVYTINPPGVLAACTDAMNLSLLVQGATNGSPASASSPAIAPSPVTVAMTGSNGGTGTAIIDAAGGLRATVSGPGTYTFSFTAQNVMGQTATATATITFPTVANPLTVSVVDGADKVTQITDYRWIIEEDKTFYVDHNCTTNPLPAGCPQIISNSATTSNPGSSQFNYGTSFHTSAMNVVAQGCTGPLSCESGQSVQGVPAVCDVGNGVCRTSGTQWTPSLPSQVALDPTKRYYISILPGDAANPFNSGYQGSPQCASTILATPAGTNGQVSVPSGTCGHGMGGAPIAKGQTAVIVLTQPSPFPAAHVTTFVYEDDYPLNGEYDAGGGVDVIAAQEPGLGGFQILLQDVAGATGDMTGTPTYDMFNQPLSNALAGTIDPVTLLDACPISTNVTSNALAAAALTLTPVNATTLGSAALPLGATSFTVAATSIPGALTVGAALSDNSGVIPSGTTVTAVAMNAAGTAYSVTMSQPTIAASAVGDPISVTGAQAGITGMVVTCPKYESDGQTLSPLSGMVEINNLYPGRYSIQAIPGADRIARGEEWLQTNTLDGQKAHDAFLRIGEPAYFQEYGPAGFHVNIGYANPAIINNRRHNAGNTGWCASPNLSSLTNGNGTLVGQLDCSNTVKGYNTLARMSRTPDERLYGSGSRAGLAWTQCFVALSDPDGATFAFAKCDPVTGAFSFGPSSPGANDGVPAGNWMLTIFDQWNDEIIDGISLPVGVNCPPSAGGGLCSATSEVQTSGNLANVNGVAAVTITGAVPGSIYLASGVQVSDSAGDVPAGATVAGASSAAVSATATGGILTANSQTLTFTSKAPSWLAAGVAVSDAAGDIPAGTTVLNFATSTTGGTTTTTVTLSQAATASATRDTITFATTQTTVTLSVAATAPATGDTFTFMTTTNQSTTVASGTGANGANLTVNLGEVATHQWQANVYTKTFLDTTGSGLWADSTAAAAAATNVGGQTVSPALQLSGAKAGVILVPTNIRFRDGSISNLNSTDASGIAVFNEVFPLFNWYVVETDDSRFKNTGVHIVYDAGGPVDNSSPGAQPCYGTTAAGANPCGNSIIGSGLANTYEKFPLPADLRIPGAVYCASADCIGHSEAAEQLSLAAGLGTTSDPFSAFTQDTTNGGVQFSGGFSTGRIDPPLWWGTYGWQGYSGQGNFIEWGKKPFVPGETGGIRGHVVYASTRPFDNPALLVQNQWEPLVPRVTINLYQLSFAADGVTEQFKLVDTTTTTSWDDWAQGYRQSLPIGTASVTAGSNVITFSGAPSQALSAGSGIIDSFGAFPGGTTVVSATGNTVTLSAAATGTFASDTISSYVMSSFAEGGAIPNMSCPGQTTSDLFFYGIKNQPQWIDFYNNVQHGAGGSTTQMAYNAQFKCYDGMHTWNQLVPAPYDGMYSFPSVTGFNPVTGQPTGTNCSICVQNIDSADPYRYSGSTTPGQPYTNPTFSANGTVASGSKGTPVLPPGQYIVEVVIPPGYQLVKEEDKNILIGDQFIAPAVVEFPNYQTNVFILPDQAAIGSTYNANNAQNPTVALGRNTLPNSETDTGMQEEFWPCVGALRQVPDFISLFPQSQEVAPFAGAYRNLCDRKLVTLNDQTSALAKFYIWTPTHIAGHFTGIILDDFTSEFDPYSPQFGEKFAPSYLPVSVKDWAGNEISRVYSDQFGLYNGLSYSTWEANPPNPTGYAPTMMVMCMNDSGYGTVSPWWDTNAAGKTSTQRDPFFQTGYSQFCYELPFMPGRTGYFDTPVTPDAAFTNGYNHPDCSYPNLTPAVSSVSGDVAGPWVSAAGHPLTINALGDQQVDNYGYSGPSQTTAPWNTQHITRHYGFGSGQGTVTIGGVAAAVTAWSDTQIVVNVPSGLPACQVQQQVQYGQPTTTTNQTVTVGTIGGVALTSGSATFTVSGTVAPAWLVAGVSLSGTGIASGTTVSSVTSTPASGRTRASYTVVMSGKATATSGRGGETVTASQTEPVTTAQTTYCGQLQITTASGQSSVDTVTVTVGGKTPTLLAAGQTIQSAIDAASPGDMIVVPPGIYNEMVIMWKPVRLQGVGAASSIIDANTQPAGKLLNPWRTRIDCLFGLTSQGRPRVNNDMGCTTGWADATGYQATSEDAKINDVQFPTIMVDRLPFEAILGWDASLNGNLAEQSIEPSLMGAEEGAAITVLSKGVRFVDASTNPTTLITAYGAAPGDNTNSGAVFPVNTVLLSENDCQANTTQSVTINTTNVAPSYSFGAAAGGTDTTNRYPGNFYCNPSAIDGLGIRDASQGGGGIYVHAYAHYLQIANNRVYNNLGTLSGGITIGQGEHPDLNLGGANSVITNPPSCELANQNIANAPMPFCFDTHVNVHNNAVYDNVSLGDELFSSTPAGAGGISVNTGADYYTMTGNWVCGNLSSGDGGGISHIGWIKDGLIQNNQIIFNQTSNPSISTNGAGLLVMGAPDVDPTSCGANNDQDCLALPTTVTPSDGSGPGTIVNANLILGNSADAGSGGGLRLQNINGNDIVNWPNQTVATTNHVSSYTEMWNSVSVTNNVIVNNVAGWDGGGVSLQDALFVDIVNNTVTHNDSTATAGPLFGSLFAPLSSAPTTQVGCYATANNVPGATGSVTGVASCAQVAGVVSVTNSAVLQANTLKSNGSNAATALACPAAYGGVNCYAYSDPLFYNNLVWQNRSFVVTTGGMGAGNGNEQQVVTLMNADPSFPPSSKAANPTAIQSQTSTGMCPTSGSAYWDIGVRGDVGPETPQVAGVQLYPYYSALDDLTLYGNTSTTSYGNVGGAGWNPGFVTAYCNGGRTPPEAGGQGWFVPPGTNETGGAVNGGTAQANGTNPMYFSLVATATTDEGNNWINMRWGPLSLTNPNNDSATSNTTAPVFLGNYSIASGSNAIGKASGTIAGGLTTGNAQSAIATLITADYFGNKRPTTNGYDIGAVEFQPPPAQIAVAETTTSFGNVQTGQSATITLTITNTAAAGSSGLLVSAPTFTTSNGYIAASTNCPATGTGLAAGGSATCTVTLTFAPTGAFTNTSGAPAAALESATVSIASNASNGAQSVSVSGTAQPPVVTISSPVAFGTVADGSLNYALVTVSNAAGYGPVYLAATPAVSGTGYAYVATGAHAGTCSTTAVIAAGGSCTIGVSFDPATSATDDGTLGVTVGAYAGATKGALEQSVSLSASLSGTGAAPSGSISPSGATQTYTFTPNVQVGQTATSTTTWTVTNTSPFAVTPTITAGTGGSQSQFALSGCTGVLAAAGSASGTSCTFTIGFTPTGTGTKTGTFRIAIGSTTLTTITVNGTGQNPSATLRATPGSASFGTVYDGATKSETFTYTNTGVGPITLGATPFSFAPGSSSAFTLGANTCANTTVAAGGTCTVTVNFKPSSAATSNATLNGTDVAAGLALSGSGSTSEVTLAASAFSGGASTVTVTNVNAAAATLSSFGIAKSGTAGNTTMAITSATCTTNANSLASGGTCTLTVTATNNNATKIASTWTVTVTPSTGAAATVSLTTN